VLQILRYSNACLVYKQKNYLENLFFLLLIRIEEFQRKDATALRIKKQLLSKIIRDVCSTRDWSINKRIVFFFYAVLVSDKLSLKIELLRLYYDNSLTRHFKIKKTRTLISRKFYWLRIIADINAYIKRCDICQQNKTLRYCLYNKLVLFSVLSRSWAEIFINFIIELSASCCENNIYNAILIVIDCYSKISLYLLVKFI